MKFHLKSISAVFIKGFQAAERRAWMLVCFSIFSLSAQPRKTTHVLMLGDSHMVGYFGEHLQRNLHQLGSFHILSVAIGGAGSQTFTSAELKNTCCGYRIRRTWADDSIGYSSPVRIVVGTLHPDFRPLGRTWNKNVDSLMVYWQPDLVIVELGNNRIDNHSGLLQKIRKHKPHIPIYWISPFLRPGLQNRIAGIQKALKVDGNAFMIPAWDLAGHDTLSTFHMSSNRARRASERLARRICDTLVNRNPALYLQRKNTKN